MESCHHRYVFLLSLTARNLLQKIARDSGMSYRQIAMLVNKAMRGGTGLIESVQEIAKEEGLDPKKYKINPSKILEEMKSILREDYSQTLMISAVLGQLVEASGNDRLPPPAFFAFLEILSIVPTAPVRKSDDTPTSIDETTTRMIELITTLVSVICEWSEEGVIGISTECPKSLMEVAKAVFRKTKLLQSGMWTCISCGTIVDAKTTRALMCEDCDAELNPQTDVSSKIPRERIRTGYGQTNKGDSLE